VHRTYLNKPQAEVLDVNQSPVDNRFISGIMCVSRSLALWSLATERNDSTALSRTLKRKILQNTINQSPQVAVGNQMVSPDGDISQYENTL